MSHIAGVHFRQSLIKRSPWPDGTQRRRFAERCALSFIGICRTAWTRLLRPAPWSVRLITWSKDPRILTATKSVIK